MSVVASYEVEAILRFEGATPTEEEIEEMLDCIVQEWIVEEV